MKAVVGPGAPFHTRGDLGTCSPTASLRDPGADYFARRSPPRPRHAYRPARSPATESASTHHRHRITTPCQPSPPPQHASRGTTSVHPRWSPNFREESLCMIRYSPWPPPLSRALVVPTPNVSIPHPPVTAARYVMPGVRRCNSSGQTSKLSCRRLGNGTRTGEP